MYDDVNGLVLIDKGLSGNGFCVFGNFWNNKYDDVFLFGVNSDVLNLGVVIELF